MDPIKKLDEMLTEAGIPHEYIVELWNTPGEPETIPFCEADKYLFNQIVYGRYDDDHWKIDAVWQRGSYGRVGNLLEVYGMMIGNEPKVYSAEEVFRMIEEDWKKQ